MPDAPVVFISSTSDDLKQHREQAESAAKAMGFFPLMMEYFPADGSQQSLPACLEHVGRAKVVIALVAHRYGWVPEAPGNAHAKKSITWLECEQAWTAGTEVLAFLADPKHDWPEVLHESYRLVTERKTPGIGEEVERNEANLQKFKQELNCFVRATFTDAASVRALVSEALHGWKERHPTVTVTAPGDPQNYLRYHEDENRQIRIRGLRSKRAEPYFFGIDEIYIPLTTQTRADDHSGKRTLRSLTGGISEERRTPLEQALSNRRIVVIGEPGSGKSTFLRRIAFELCRNLLGTRPPNAPPFLAETEKRFPIIVRAADLATRLSDPARPPKPDDSPDWIPWFLGKQSEEYKWGLDGAWFRRKLENGETLVMIDGLDEAPERVFRERMSRLLEKATRSFDKCDFLVTTRDQTYWGDAVLGGFHALRIEALEMPAIQTFFGHFAKALALSESESKSFLEALEYSLQHRFEIRDMARNPVMLTALAVLQHNDQRLPEYRVELYEEILRWLAAARERKPGRPSAEKCLEVMRKLALAMQDHSEGRVVQINKRKAAELAAVTLGGTVEQNERLLEDETEDSGILVPVGQTDLKFWHLSFQEYLAAREIASLSDEVQIERVVTSRKLYKSEWRETMRLLGGVLRQQGTAKIEGLFQAILTVRGKSLGEQACCAGLLGSLMKDLAGMGYEPATPEYKTTLQALDRLFMAGESQTIPLKDRIEAAEALGRVGDPRLDGDKWIVIPAGTFWMGAQKKNKRSRNYDAAAEVDESPVHEVTLRPFRIGRFPVTVQGYEEFFSRGGYARPEYWAAGGFGESDEPEDWQRQVAYPNRPVVGVSWYEAAAYCAWAGGRLPTEAEWERAARGPLGERHPWGNAPGLDPSRANYSFDGGPRAPTPVGLFPLGNSREGLSDMLGNVWEWCSDLYGLYAHKTEQNPPGSATGEGRIVRGGCWAYEPKSVRVSCRVGFRPSYRAINIGFRCAGELR